MRLPWVGVGSTYAALCAIRERGCPGDSYRGFQRASVSRPRRSFTGAEKMAILGEQLIDKVPLPEVCERHISTVHPDGMAPRWSSTNSTATPFSRYGCHMSLHTNCRAAVRCGPSMRKKRSSVLTVRSWPIHSSRRQEASIW